MPTGLIVDADVVAALQPLMDRLQEAERIREERGLGIEADQTVTVHLCHLQRLRDALGWSPVSEEDTP